MKKFLLVLTLLFVTGTALGAATINTAPSTMYFLVIVTPASANKPPFIQIAQTASQAACEAQRDAWNLLLAPNKVICLTHNNADLELLYPQQ
jgi:hypothetical protein